jgi:hypothetical protein
LRNSFRSFRSEQTFFSGAFLRTAKKPVSGIKTEQISSARFRAAISFPKRRARLSTASGEKRPKTKLELSRGREKRFRAREHEAAGAIRVSIWRRERRERREMEEGELGENGSNRK